MRPPAHALTNSSNGTLRVIESVCGVSAAFDPTTDPRLAHTSPFHPFKAIWDTGATGTVITQAVVDAVKLKPTGMIRVNTAAGVSLQETYLVNLRLPNAVGFHSLQVTKAPLVGTGMLIGMDVISMGDFAITNKDGKTIFTFRVPSCGRLDFVKEENRLRAGGDSTNGQSKKKKKAKR